MNEEDLVRCYAMFAMLGWIVNGEYHEDEIPHKAFRMAKKMLEVEKSSDSSGIIAIKPRRRSKNEEN